MSSLRGSAIKCLLLFVFFSSFLAARTDDPEKILTSFRNSYKWLENAGFQVRISTYPRDPSSEPELWMVYDYYNDGNNRIAQKGMKYVSVDPEVQITGQHFRNVYSRDHRGLCFSEIRWGLEGDVVPEEWGPWLDIYEDAEDRMQQTLPQEFRSMGPIMGYVSPFLDHYRIADLLTVDTINLREDEVDGARRCIITSALPEGDVELWLQPEKGYVLEKCIFTREIHKHTDKDGNPILIEFMDGTLLEKSVDEITVSSYKYEKEHYIPEHLETKHTFIFDDGHSSSRKSLIELSDIQLDPDFEALQVFDLDFQEGLAVNFMKKNGSRFYGLVWSNGEFVLDAERLGLKHGTEELLDAIGKEAAIPEKSPPERASLQLDGMQSGTGHSMQHYRSLILLSLAGLSILFAFPLLYLRIKKRRQ
ncbi:MAG: hypothetical protein GX130_12870 [Candidatus Hydrogenedens sp.]|nr:hypothetical protein [Candidatus Hydrogenedens sp.]